MDFSLSPKAEEYRRRVAAFMDEHVYPNEELAERQVIASGNEHHEPEIVTGLRKKAESGHRASGLTIRQVGLPRAVAGEPIVLPLHNTGADSVHIYVAERS